MSKPTVLSPWYVVVRNRDDGSISGDYRPPEYYVSQQNAEEPWSTDSKQAMLFTSLHSANRVAKGAGAEVRVVVDEEDLKAYRAE